MARNNSRTIGPAKMGGEKIPPKVKEKDFGSATKENTPKYVGIINPDGKFAKRISSPFLLVTTVVLLVIFINYLAGENSVTGIYDNQDLGFLVILGGAASIIIYAALHFMKKTSLKPFVYLGWLVLIFSVLGIFIYTVFDTIPTIPNIKQLIVGPQYIEDVKVKRDYEEQVAKFHVMEFVGMPGFKNNTGLKKSEIVKVASSAYIKKKDNPGKEPYIKVIKGGDDGLFSGPVIEVPFRFLKERSPEALFQKPEFMEKEEKGKAQGRVSDYKIYQPGTYIFNLKAGETTDHWIQIANGLNFYSVNSKDNKFIINFFDGQSINAWDPGYLPAKYKFKLFAVTPQNVTMIVK